MSAQSAKSQLKKALFVLGRRRSWNQVNGKKNKVVVCRGDALVCREKMVTAYTKDIVVGALYYY